MLRNKPAGFEAMSEDGTESRLAEPALTSNGAVVERLSHSGGSAGRMTLGNGGRGRKRPVVARGIGAHGVLLVPGGVEDHNRDRQAGRWVRDVEAERSRTEALASTPRETKPSTRA